MADLPPFSSDDSYPEPDLPDPHQNPRPWFASRRVWILVAVFAATAVAAFLGRKTILGQYRAWSQERHAHRAAESFAKGDYERAILDGRSALELNPLDVETNRIIAKSAEAVGAPEAIQWRARLNVISPGDFENTIAWTRDALNLGAVDAAEDALLTTRTADRTRPEYHAAAGEVAAAKKDFGAAQNHWSEAVRLAPQNDEYRLKLASIQIKSRSATDRSAAADALAQLGEKSASQLPALRALIEDAMNHQEFAKARELADRLIASPGATFMDRIGRLSVLRASGAPDSTSYLEKLRDDSLNDPEQLAKLLNWMNENELTLFVSEWAPKLPATLASKPPVCIPIAEAYGRARDWEHLKAHSDNGPWKDYEHIRLAYQARVLDNAGTEVAAKTTWERALAETENRAPRLAQLAKLAQNWYWNERAEVALRRLSADESTPLWVLDALWDITLKGGNSEELHKLSRLIVKARPKNPAARDSFLWLSLLRHSDEGSTHSLVAELQKEYPDDVKIARTYALSRFMQGKVFEAVNALEKFPPDALRTPGVALYYGVFLQASGNSEKAAEYLALAETGPLLRDEGELLTKVKRDSRLNTLVPKPKAPPSPASK